MKLPAQREDLTSTEFFLSVLRTTIVKQRGDTGPVASAAQILEHMGTNSMDGLDHRTR